MTPFPSPDYQRMYRLYRYLFTCLAMTRKKDGSPNYAAISKRLSPREDFRKVESDLRQYTPPDEQSLPQPNHQASHPSIRWGALGQLTTGPIVTMLARLLEQLEQEYKAVRDPIPFTRLLTQDDILVVLYKLIELTSEERRQLNLESSDTVTLLQRTLLALHQSGGINNHDVVFQLYQSAIGISLNDPRPLESLDDIDQCIEKTVADLLDYLPQRPNQNWNRRETYQNYPGTDIQKKILTQKAQREMRRLLARSGNGNQPGYRPHTTSSGTVHIQSYINHYLDEDFVAKLAQTVVANERLTGEFPVYLKTVLTQAVGPLPFADRQLGILSTDDFRYPSLLHPALRWIDQSVTVSAENRLPAPGDYELASQESSQVVVEFYIKVPQDYQPSVERVFQKLASQNRNRIDFSIRSTGIGGTLSHVIKIINTTLLFDIPCLQEYFSIAHDVTTTQDIIRNNVASPVWGHNLVKLCYKSTMAKTLLACQRDRISSYEDFAFSEPIGQGDFCGFDFFRAQVHAALQARLQAIRQTGVNPREYIEQLCHHIEQATALQDAWSYLKGYPFSTFAMQGSLEQEILVPLVGQEPLTATDPYICFEACLSIIEALLDEGCYRSAHRYLVRIAVLNDLAQQELAIANPTNALLAPSSITIFSGRLLTRYRICLAYYYYTYDPDDPDLRYLPPHCTPDINREGLVRRAWQTLDQAQKHIHLRLRKYVIINEISQATFHPHYALLSQIAILKAKLLLFFSRFVPGQDQASASLLTDRFLGQRRTKASIHWGQLYLTEKARLYAAADGDSERYACYAATQCWLHLMTAYTDPADLHLSAPLNRPDGQQGRMLSPQQCLDWAKTLRNHALISYADIGRRYYYQMKEKTGLPRHTRPDPFGPYNIDRMPAIYEARGHDYDRLYQQLSQQFNQQFSQQASQQANATGEDLWVWDMALLTVDPEYLPKLSPKHPTQTIYLFGTSACYLFFARGLYLLCSDRFTEFNEGQKQETLPDQIGDDPREQWDYKLHHATRLLNLAWAIAEEGGQIERVPNDATHSNRLRITRPLSLGDRTNEYSPPEVNSVRNLYPHRINEIADLGKIFAATCLALRLHTAPSAQRPTLARDIQHLLEMLHGEEHLAPLGREIIAGQTRYNGHLAHHFEQIKLSLLNFIEYPNVAHYRPLTTERTTTITNNTSELGGIIPQLRQRLLQNIFTTILNPYP